MNRIAKPFVWLLITCCAHGALAAGCPGKLPRVERSLSLEADYAQSVFRFRGGTAYFIGGDPGFLLTANHVISESADQANQICSEFLAPLGKTSVCFDVSLVAELPDWDLALIKLKESLPSSVRSTRIFPSKTRRRSV